MENGMSMCQEITIVKVVIQNMAEYCIKNNIISYV